MDVKVIGQCDKRQICLSLKLTNTCNQIRPCNFYILTINMML